MTGVLTCHSVYPHLTAPSVKRGENRIAQPMLWRSVRSQARHTRKTETSRRPLCGLCRPVGPPFHSGDSQSGATSAWLTRLGGAFRLAVASRFVLPGPPLQSMYRVPASNLDNYFIKMIKTLQMGTKFLALRVRAMCACAPVTGQALDKPAECVRSAVCASCARVACVGTCGCADVREHAQPCGRTRQKVLICRQKPIASDSRQGYWHGVGCRERGF